VQKFENTNKSEDDLINKEIEQLHSQLSELKKKEAQKEQTSSESQSNKDMEIKLMSEKCEEIQIQNKHLNEQLKEAFVEKSQLSELTAKVQELEKKLSVSANIIKGLKTTKTSESSSATEESARLKELLEENEDLKSKNFRLKSGLAVTEKSISQLEDVIKSIETSVFEEINPFND
jgi:chromosome segregation ATPase